MIQMKAKKLGVMVGAAALLCCAAYFTGGGSGKESGRLNGKPVCPKLDVSSVARIEIGDRLVLAAGDDGWRAESQYGYPADRAKIAENLLSLAELKVGQAVRGRELGDTVAVILKDSAGREIERLLLGDRHRGRYVGFEGGTVLVSDTLDAFDGDLRDWCDTRIKDFDVSFTGLADPALSAEETGVSTGFVHSVTAKVGTNDVVRVARLGGSAPDGNGRYFKPDDGEWTFIIPSYAAERMTAEPKDNP